MARLALLGTGFAVSMALFAACGGGDSGGTASNNGGSAGSGGKDGSSGSGGSSTGGDSATLDVPTSDGSNSAPSTAGSRSVPRANTR